MNKVPDTLNIIDGTYDDWVPINRIMDDAIVAEHIQTINCDTRDFALGWGFKKPELYKKAECGLEVRSNEGLARARRIAQSKSLGDYLIKTGEILPWLKKLCERSGGYDEDWRYLVADVKDCMGWDIKYIRFIRHDCEHFMVCNAYWMPIKWRKILDNLKNPY